MTTEQLKTEPLFKQALAVSKDLLDLCDGFSHSDQNFLVWQLRNTSIEIPAGVAAQLLQEEGANATGAILKATTAIELVHRVYPAMDTAAVPGKLADLLTAVRGQ